MTHAADTTPNGAAKPRGRFITLEGVDGAGKSTHVESLAAQLRAAGLSVLVTREPGGTSLGESLRALLLHETMTLETETLLMFAARCEHVRQVIEPALARGKWVVCDRFTDATYAYQGGGRGLGIARIAALEAWVHPDLQPDYTVFFDAPQEVARARLGASSADGAGGTHSTRGPLDRFEREGADFFSRTRAAYHQRAAQFPQRFCVVDGSRSIAQVRADVQALARSWLKAV